MYMFGCREIIFMAADDKTSILLSDVSIEGDLIEKDKIIIDAKINGDIKAEAIETHQKSNIKGNIKASIDTLGGQMKGNINSNQNKMLSEKLILQQKKVQK